MASPDRMPPEPGPDTGIDEIQADIARTRKELGDTVGALSAKADVKQRTKQKAAETKERVIGTAQTVGRTAAEEAKTNMPVIAVVTVSAIAVAVIVWRRRH